MTPSRFGYHDVMMFGPGGAVLADCDVPERP
jgi:hypothetical protein